MHRAAPRDVLTVRPAEVKGADYPSENHDGDSKPKRIRNFEITQSFHLAFDVRLLDRAVQWYPEFLRYRTLRGRSGIAWVTLGHLGRHHGGVSSATAKCSDETRVFRAGPY